MTNFNVNISPEDIKSQLDNENKVKNFTTFDEKNYLNVRLGDNETSKTLTIRLLPISSEGGFPFEKVHMHTIKVSKEISSSGWKNFVCPTKNDMGDKCPFCMLAEEARKARFSTISEAEKTKFKEIESINRPVEKWVARCIERGHESDGVKFWLMSGAKDGPYAKIMNVWKTRWEKAQSKGQINNIFDLNNGKDLDITITRSADGKNVISVVDSDEKTPLTEDFELGTKWINDTKKWSDVYRVKPFEYMRIIADGGYPVFDKNKNQYVDRDAKNEEDEKAIQSQIMEQKVDYTRMPTANELNSGSIILNTPQVDKIDDDLPY